MTTQGYTHPEFLVDAAWVDGHKGDANVVVVDCDVDAGYNRGHIPGAVMVPDNFEKNPDTGRVHIMSPEQFAAMCQGLGIGDDTLVVTYDNAQGLTAARLWWALNYYGHTNVKVLNGGWRRWVTEGHKVDFTRPNANTGSRGDRHRGFDWLRGDPQPADLHDYHCGPRLRSCPGRDRDGHTSRSTRPTLQL